jgi:N-acetyl-alpha-D-muramate 1-phosphate uridylyltransferase
MKAMILAAGRGERMRPLTDTRPKALLSIGGKALIEWHLEKLAAAGFSAVVINHAHLGALIESALGDGKRFGVPIHYSPERDALETAGGIAQALPLLGDAPFAVVNADVYSDFDYACLASAVRRLAQHEATNKALAHLVLVPNPEHHVDGDFALEGGLVGLEGKRFTFSGMAAYQPALFNALTRGSKAPLAPLLRKHIPARRITGELCAARWCDVGTPARLAALERELATRSP